MAGKPGVGQIDEPAGLWLARRELRRGEGIGRFDTAKEERAARHPLRAAADQEKLEVSERPVRRWVEEQEEKQRGAIDAAIDTSKYRLAQIAAEDARHAGVPAPALKPEPETSTPPILAASTTSDSAQYQRRQQPRRLPALETTTLNTSGAPAEKTEERRSSHLPSPFGAAQPVTSPRDLISYSQQRRGQNTVELMLAAGHAGEAQVGLTGAKSPRHRKRSSNGLRVEALPERPAPGSLMDPARNVDAAHHRQMSLGTLEKELDQFREGMKVTSLSDFSDAAMSVLGVQRAKKKFLSLLKGKRTYKANDALANQKWWEARRDHAGQLKKHRDEVAVGKKKPNTPAPVGPGPLQVRPATAARGGARVDWSQLLDAQAQQAAVLSTSDQNYRNMLRRFEGVQALMRWRLKCLVEGKNEELMGPLPDDLLLLRTPGSPSAQEAIEKAMGFAKAAKANKEAAEAAAAAEKSGAAADAAPADADARGGRPPRPMSAADRPRPQSCLPRRDRVALYANSPDWRKQLATSPPAPTADLDGFGSGVRRLPQARRRRLPPPAAAAGRLPPAAANHGGWTSQPLQPMTTTA